MSMDGRSEAPSPASDEFPIEDPHTLPRGLRWPPNPGLPEPFGIPPTADLLAILEAHDAREVPVWQHRFTAYDDLDECGACGLSADTECHGP